MDKIISVSEKEENVMDKNILKKFSIQAHRDLLLGVEKKAKQQFQENEFDKSAECVIEETVYYWFVRIITIRYMELNGILPNERLITIDKDTIISCCDEISTLMPYFFEKDDLKALLIPDNLFGEEGVIRKLIDMVPKSEWINNVEIIGWLYQYFNSEKKAEVFDDLKKNIKISKENIPAATQLFTPDWIVRYMVQNSIGRTFSEMFPENKLQETWDFYIETADQPDCVKADLKELQTKNGKLKLDDISCMDPCCGSGNILIYVFDLFFQMYVSNGYSNIEAVSLIVEKNLYGLDIDKRAAELAYFSIMMKGCQYDKDFLSRNIQPNIYSVEESNTIEKAFIDLFGVNDQFLRSEFLELLTEMTDAKEYGSFVRTKKRDWKALRIELNRILHETKELQDDRIDNSIISFTNVLNAAELLSKQYDTVITNPPYMGKKSLNRKLSEYLDLNYSKGKSELYSAFILRCSELTKENGFTSMITIHSWMFISSFQQLREKILDEMSVYSVLHTGAATFEDLSAFNVLASAFMFRKIAISHFQTVFIRLADLYSTSEKLQNYRNPDNIFTLEQDVLKTIPGYPFVYWIPDSVRDNFERFGQLREYAEPRQGLATGNNHQFVRYWYEVDFENIYFHAKNVEEVHASDKKWVPYNKGGFFRKWYGMNEYVLAFDKENYAKLAKAGNHLPSRQYYFKPGVTWSLFGFENFGVRYKDEGFVFDVSGSSMFPGDKGEKEKKVDEDAALYILAFLASKVAFRYLSVLAPTVNFQVGNIGDLPFCCDNQMKDEIIRLARKNIELSKEDWDSYETSWDFKMHPFLKYGVDSISKAYHMWKAEAEERYLSLKENEELINSRFIELYHLKEDITPDVMNRDVTVHRIYDTKEEIPEDMMQSAYVRTRKDEVKDFISYAVGCIFGRYSLKEPGVIYAGGKWNKRKYSKYMPVQSDVVPLGESGLYQMDMVEHFIWFVEKAFGKESLLDNLKFIAHALDDKANESVQDVLRNYFRTTFYSDHLQKYQKHPIYWMFSSGKKHGFKGLVYMHRFKKDTLQNMIHFILESREFCAKNKTKSMEMDTYLEKLEQYIEHVDEVDPDLGVTENYKKLEGLLEKIR